jgi:hypothetical protein
MKKILIILFAAFSVLAVGSLTAQPLLVEVLGLSSAKEKFEPFEDLTIADLGINLLFEYSNVTYRTDGLGSDVLDSKVVGTSLKSSGAIRFGVGSSYAKTPTIGITDYLVQGKTMTTNDTVDDDFDFDYKKKKQDHAVDFSTTYNDDADINSTLSNYAATLYNVTGSYARLNDTITAIESSDYSLDEGYFDGNGRSKKYEYSTVVVGYEDFQEGAIDDLRAYLASENNVDTGEVTIQEYNLSACYLAFNFSESFNNYLKDVVDIAMDNYEAGYKVMQVGYGYIDYSLPYQVNYKKEELQASFFDSVIASLEEGVSGIVTTIGTPLGELAGDASGIINDYIVEPVQSFIGSDPVATISNAADTVINNAGAVFSAALDGTSDFFLDITDTVGEGVGNLVEKPFGVTGNFATGLLNSLIIPLLIIAVIAIVALIGYRQFLSTGSRKL